MQQLPIRTILSLLSLLLWSSPSLASSCPGSRLQNDGVIFGITVCSHRSMPRTLVKHVAVITAEYLDNDENGKADNPAVVNALSRNRATLLILPDEEHLEHLEEHMERLAERTGREPQMQPVLLDDIHPGGAARGEFDATLEEVLHLITQAGYAYAYPTLFGERPGTAIAKAMDRARGGYFATVPSRYPRNAWYSYDDRTCEYNCMISEYFYWALTSLLNGQNFPGRQEEIAHEWRANTPEKLRRIDPDVTRLLTNPRYALPSRLPDGHYRPWQ
ncbi:MAG: hypothetical protein HQL50_05915 [Magnetococcales bacterium]|nr:hypothetical protein [Magnetococcales bacterium]